MSTWQSESLTCPMFMAGYIQMIMEVQTHDIRALVSIHWVELMDDAELYGWEALPAFHAVWLQQMDQGWVTWTDAEFKLVFRCSLVWHHAAPARKCTPTSVSQPQQPPKTTTPFNITTKPGPRA